MLRNKQTGQQNTAGTISGLFIIFNVNMQQHVLKRSLLLVLSSKKFLCHKKTNTVNFYINVSPILRFIFVIFCSTWHHQYNTCCYLKPDTLIKHFKLQSYIGKKLIFNDNLFTLYSIYSSDFTPLIDFQPKNYTISYN